MILQAITIWQCDNLYQLEPFIKSEWGYEVFFSSFTNSSRGVMILMNNNFEYKVERVKTDKNGNYIVLDVNIQGKRITLKCFQNLSDPRILLIIL